MGGICLIKPPEIFGINSQRAGFCQIYLTELAPQKSHRRDLPEKPAQDFWDKHSVGGNMLNLLNRNWHLKISQAGFAQKTQSGFLG